MSSTAVRRFGDAGVPGGCYADAVMTDADGRTSPFAALNEAQRRAVEHGMDAVAAGRRPGPLLVVAGAGTGKTRTLTARVARLILAGADPRRVLLLTFTRRAAREMTRRAEELVARAITTSSSTADAIDWSGTFHAVGQRLLRLHARQIGLNADFTVLDRGDAEDLIDIVRTEQGLAETGQRFPRKGPCLAIYSLAVNSGRGIDDVLRHGFPQYLDFADELRRLFAGFVDAKQDRDLLDYDDLLLYWARALAEPAVAAAMRERFDHVLVDEYQDTNPVQAAILHGLSPDGGGLTVVGDDAQAIYGFRAATVENILEFPRQFAPAARVVRLEENYRSTQRILTAANAVIERAARRYDKELFTHRGDGEKPLFVTVEDDTGQADHIIRAVLRRREEGIDLKRQAVLMRAGWHSGLLEVELGRRNIPFVKYGGLRFLEAAHVKDVVAVLRWAENPRDPVAANRVLQILPGIGPTNARRALAELDRGGTPGEALRRFVGPGGSAAEIETLADLLDALAAADADWSVQPDRVRRWYDRHIERLYDNPQVRRRDLEQFERIALTYPGRARFLTEVALDPPDTAADEAGEPLIDDDYLILSTIHSAKGQEYDAIHVLNVIDGCIPSDMATGNEGEIEEERRLLYVAMTRARDHLSLVAPHRFYRTNQARHGGRFVTAVVSRFLPAAVLEHFEGVAEGGGAREDSVTGSDGSQVDLKRDIRDMWR